LFSIASSTSINIFPLIRASQHHEGLKSSKETCNH
jgi:hypothetical protein